MKKAAAWLMTVFLLLTGAAAPAEEAAEARYGVFDLYDMSGESAVWTGVGIPILTGILMLPETNLPEDLGAVALSDDNGLWDAQDFLPLPGTHVVFAAFDAEGDVPRYSPWSMLSVPGLPEADILTVYDTNAAGDQLYRSVSSLTPLTWEGMECMTLTLSGSARPGDPVVTEGSELAGMILAECSEGVNRYVALSPAGIYDLLFRLSAAAETVNSTMNPQEGFTVTAEGNRVTFDWSGVSGAVEEGKQRYLVVADTENNYITYGPAEGEETSATMVLTPGRTYLSGLAESAGVPDTLPEGVVITGLPEAEKLTDNGFKPMMTALVRSDAGDPTMGVKPAPVEYVTAQELQSGKFYFYSWSVYDVEERSEDTLLISMITPDNADYRYVSGWFFDPDYEAGDIWALSLEDLGFAEELKNREYAPGIYRISFYVGGKLADSFSFEIR